MSNYTKNCEAIVAQHYADCLKNAVNRSREFACTVHVYAVLTPGNDNKPPTITNFGISDWYDGSTVATFTNGERH